jgi:hypothetical protein
VEKYNGGGIQAGMLFLPEKIHAFLLVKKKLAIDDRSPFPSEALSIYLYVYIRSSLRKGYVL